eukprot:jgi/Bigna1/143673/aug1.80_g18381
MYVDASSSTRLGLPPHLHVFLVAARQILKLNFRLLSTLSSRLAHWYHQQPLGDVFAQFGPLFTLYRDYASNYARVLQTLRSNARYRKVLADSERHYIVGEGGAMSLLILPIQRVPRYRLLLQELKAATPKFHQDYEPLAEACAAVDEALTCINKAINDQKAMEVMARIQHEVAGNVMIALFKTGRSLVCEGLLESMPLITQDVSPQSPPPRQDRGVLGRTAKKSKNANNINNNNEESSKGQQRETFLHRPGGDDDGEMGGIDQQDRGKSQENVLRLVKRCAQIIRGDVRNIIMQRR